MLNKDDVLFHVNMTTFHSRTLYSPYNQNSREEGHQRLTVKYTYNYKEPTMGWYLFVFYTWSNEGSKTSSKTVTVSRTLSQNTVFCNSHKPHDLT